MTWRPAGCLDVEIARCTLLVLLLLLLLLLLSLRVESLFIYP